MPANQRRMRAPNSATPVGIAFFVLFTLLAVQLHADDAWKKSYKAWTENDLREISTDSPWAKRIKRPDLSEKDALAPNGKSEDDDDDKADKDEKGKKDSDTLFVVRWVSSRTLRRAWARGQVLRGRIPDADFEKSVPPAPDDYEITVLGPAMNSFDKANEASLQSKSYLQFKKSKQKLSPMKVEIIRSPDGNTINAIIFHFAKSTTSGEPVISSDESEAKFVSKASPHSIEAQFNFSKMKDEQGLDL